MIEADKGITWTVTQRQRLIELGAGDSDLNSYFESTGERNRCYQQLEKRLAKEHKRHLLSLKNSGFRPLLCRLEEQLVAALTSAGFVQVVTPLFLSRGMLRKMTITTEHPLSKQVFWVDEERCLRPMLAPNLYYLLKELVRLWGKPVRIFEVGLCFRKESQGAYHLNEFTMLNVVELGDLEGHQEERLHELVEITMNAVGIQHYRLEKNECHVYGNTVDVIMGDMELGSGSWGPHKLDDQWGIMDPWVGIGFGLERLAVAIEGHRNIHRVGRSLVYLDGRRLNV